MNEELIANFKKLGCTSKRDLAITLQVYSELCEVKRYWNVEYFFDEHLQCMYITGRKSKSTPASVFVPVSASENISFLRMQRYLKLGGSEETKTVFLVMVESDSTCIYYQISEGIADPPDEVPSTSRESKRVKLDKDVRKHRRLIEHSALCGTPITLSTNANADGDGNAKCE